MLLLSLLATLAHADPARIVGGTVVEDDAWPSVVALRTGDDLVCTGTLIAPDVVLTAAHCSAATEVVLETVDLDSPVLVVPIASFNVYPSWTTTYDAAWVRLEQSVTTPTATLALDCLTEEWLFDGSTAVITGFGTLDRWSSEDTTLLHQAEVPILDADCSEQGHDCMTAVSPGGELTAGGDGIDTCIGDSGGGLWVGPSAKPLLAGITSRGRRPSTTPCGDGGIYVRADAIASWIEDEAGLTLDRPACDNPSHNRPPDPRAPTLFLTAFGTGVTEIDPADDDLTDAHDFLLTELEPGLTITISSDGEVVATDTLGTARSGAFEVTVTDDGTPARSAPLSVFFVVQPDPEASGCNTTPSTTSWAWLGLLAIGLRRRRVSQLRCAGSRLAT